MKLICIILLVCLVLSCVTSQQEYIKNIDDPDLKILEVSALAGFIVGAGVMGVGMTTYYYLDKKAEWF